jgi:hypothetical protein
MASNQDTAEGVSGLGISANYNCAGTGTHDFRALGDGYLIKDGQSYFAQAYDQIDDQSC